MGSRFPHESGLSYAPVCVPVYVFGQTDQCQPIRSSACSADPADVELVSQQTPSIYRWDIVLLCWCMVFNHEPQLMLIYIMMSCGDLLHITWDNIKTIQDRAHFYVDHNREPRVFNVGQKVFLCVPHKSKTLSRFHDVFDIKCETTPDI